MDSPPYAKTIVLESGNTRPAYIALVQICRIRHPVTLDTPVNAIQGEAADNRKLPEAGSANCGGSVMLLVS